MEVQSNEYSSQESLTGMLPRVRNSREFAVEPL
jgi:hypothetical protein